MKNLSLKNKKYIFKYINYDYKLFGVNPYYYYLLELELPSFSSYYFSYYLGDYNLNLLLVGIDIKLFFLF